MMFSHCELVWKAGRLKTHAEDGNLYPIRIYTPNIRVRDTAKIQILIRIRLTDFNIYYFKLDEHLMQLH